MSWLPFRLIAVGLVALATAPSSSRAAEGQIEIEVPLFEGGAGKDFFLLAAREYEKLRPDVKVNLYLDPRIADKLQVRFLEGTFPEITNAATINYWPLIRNGDVLAVNQWLDGPSWDNPDVPWRDTFLPGAIDNYSENGKYYGVPFGQYAFVIWYNKKMFRQHGWKTPVTWDELFDLCEQVKKSGIPPMAFQGRYPYYAIPFYDHTTYHLVGPDQWKARQLLAPGALQDPASIQAIGLTRRLARDYFQAGALGMSHTESQLQFFLGKTAMIPCGAWLKSEMLGKIPDDFELGCFNLPIPSDSKAEPSALYVHVEPFFVFSKSPHPEAAVDFLRFMTSKKLAATFSRMQDIPTVVRGANTGNLSKDLEDLVTLIDNAKISYGKVPDQETFQLYGDMMYDIIGNEALSPQQVGQKYETLMQVIRKQRIDPLHVDVNHPWKAGLFIAVLAVGALAWFYRAGRELARRRTRGRAGAAATVAVPSAALPRMGALNVLLFVTPALVLYSAFVIVPSLRSFSWSLHEWDGLTNMSAMPFRGLLNFKRLLLQSDGFWIALKNNLFLMFIVPLFVIPLAMFLAASISRGVRGATLFRIVFFFPNLLGGVAATLLWLHLYNPQGGLVNAVLAPLLQPLAPFVLSAGEWLMGHHGGWHIGTAVAQVAQWMAHIDTFAWLEPKNLYWALVPISIWGAVGFNMVLYLAAMESIPESYYEAATIDGASPWRQYWTITLPLIWDVLTISIIFLVIGGMKAFEVIWLLTNQRPQTDNHTIATRMVTTLFQEYRAGEATALAVLLFLMVFIGTAATMRGMRREAVEL